tara:strand:+ start:245 stop:466 length:222 start_codon:yes stop_codon:yes gene_type:complete
MSERITASEAVYGFAAWLTTRDKAVIFGAKHNAGVAVGLIKEWLDVNKLDDPRDGIYPNNLVMPEREQARGSG